MYNITSLLSGLLFGVGLIVAGMANPAKVLAFLDLAGNWDPSLGLVMGGAVAVGVCAFFVAGKRARSYLGAPMQIPTVRKIDRRCFLGSLAFGCGWGLAGFCPGPALVLLGTGQAKVVVFVAAMLAGMVLFEQIEIARRRYGLNPSTIAE
jgi:uncharacterized protein